MDVARKNPRWPSGPLYIHLWSAVIAVVGCGDPGISSDAAPIEAKRVEAEVRAMFEQYANAQRSKGLRGELPYLDTSKTFFWVPPGYAGPIGFDSVRTIVERTAPTLRAIDPRWRTLRIEPMNDSMAAYTGELEAVTVGMNEDTTRTTLLETGFVVKRADGWKLLCGQTCPAPPKMEGP